MVAVENRLAVPVMEPRDYKARRFHIRRDVELAKYGFVEDCEGFRVAQSGAEAKPHSGGCRAPHEACYDERRRGPAEDACGGSHSRRQEGNRHGPHGGQDEETEAP